MDSDIHNREIIYCAGDGDCRILCDICDKLCMDRCNKNHIKSGVHINFFHEKQRLNFTKTNNQH